MCRLNIPWISKFPLQLGFLKYPDTEKIKLSHVSGVYQVDSLLGLVASGTYFYIALSRSFRHLGVHDCFEHEIVQFKMQP